MSVFPANIDLSTLNGSNGFKLSGAAAYDHQRPLGRLGGRRQRRRLRRPDRRRPVRRPERHQFGRELRGVRQGRRALPPNLDLSSLDGSNGFRLSGVAADDRSGFSVASAGDVNGDGFADLIVGARCADPNGNDSGASYVVFGKASGFAANLDLSSLDGSNGFQLSGVAAVRPQRPLGRLGGRRQRRRLRRPDRRRRRRRPERQLYSGASYVVFGKASGFAANLDLSSLDGSNGFQLNGAAADDHSGRSVASAGDVNGDGFDDLIVGASGADPNGDLLRRELRGVRQGRGLRRRTSTCRASTAATASSSAAWRRSTTAAARSPRRATSTATASPT